MEIQLFKNGVKIGTDKATVYIDPESTVDRGVVILTTPNASFTTTDERLIVEGPGEYEFQGIHIKGIRKDNVLSFTISSNEREIYITTSEGFSSIPDDEPFDAVVVRVTSPLDNSVVSKMPYPLIFIDSKKMLSDEIEVEMVKNINLKKINIDERNIFVLQ